MTPRAKQAAFRYSFGSFLAEYVGNLIGALSIPIAYAIAGYWAGAVLQRGRRGSVVFAVAFMLVRPLLVFSLVSTQAMSRPWSVLAYFVIAYVLVCGGIGLLGAAMLGEVRITPRGLMVFAVGLVVGATLFALSPRGFAGTLLAFPITFGTGGAVLAEGLHVVTDAESGD